MVSNRGCPFPGWIGTVPPVGFAATICMSFLLFSSFARSDEAFSAYVTNVAAEREEEYHEIRIELARPPSPKSAPLASEIINAGLTQEIRTHFEQKFGYITFDDIRLMADRFTNFTDFRAAVIDLPTQNEERRNFGEYMVKRISEWHLEHYMKSDENLHAVYQVKERVSNLNLNLAPRTTFHAKFSFSESAFEVQLTHLFLDAKFRGDGDDKWLLLGFQLNRTLNLLTSYTIGDGMAGIELQKQHSTFVSSILKSTQTTTAIGKSPRQSFLGYFLNCLF